MQAVTAMSMDQTGTKIAVVGSQNRYGNEKFIWVIRASDGGHETQIGRFQLGTAGLGEHQVSDPGLIYAPNGIIYVAFKQESATMRDAFDGSFTNYAGRKLVGAFNPLTVSFDWLKEQTQFFGYSSSLVYKNFCTGCGNILVGGANDWSHIDSNQNAKKWMIAITRLTEVGDSPTNSVYHINQSDNHTDHLTAPYVDNMHLDGNILFGSTRSHDEEFKDGGQETYVWKVTLDGTGEPDPSTLVCNFWEEKNTGHSILVIGMKPNLVNGNVHVIMQFHNKEIGYYVWDWTTGDKQDKDLKLHQDHLRVGGIQSDLLHSRAIFHGSRTETRGGITIYQSYTGGSKVAYKGDFGDFTRNAAAVIDSSLTIEDSCMDLYTGASELGDIKVTGASLTVRDQSWQPNTLAGQTSSINILKIWDMLDGTMDDGWCSPPSNISSVTAGSAPTAVCTFWDDLYESIDFIPNTATGASGLCTDAAPTWIYSIDQTNISTISDDLKVSIDSITNKIWVKGLVTGTVEGTYTLQVTGHLPGTPEVASFDFIVDITPCKTIGLTPIVTNDQTYYTIDAAGSYNIEFFTADPLCTQPIIYSNQILTAQSGFITGVGSGNALSWQTDFRTDLGQYDIRMTGSTICAAPVSVDYILNVIDQCDKLAQVIDFDNTVFTSPVITIKIMEAEKILSWADSVVTTSMPLVDCGPIQWELLNQDESAIDSSLFTFDPLISELSVYTEDAAKVFLYPLKIKMTLTDFPDNPGATKDFTVDVIADDTCFAENISITPSTEILDISYVVARPSVTTNTFSDFTVSPIWCQISYAFTVTPALVAPDDSAITYDPATKSFSVQTDNILLVYEDVSLATATQFAVYDIMVTAVTLGVDTGIGFTWKATLQSPCFDATLTYAPSNWPISYQYFATYPADVQNILGTDVSSTEFDTTCPYEYEYTLVNIDGTDIDPTLFTYNIIPSITTETSDRLKIGVYDLTLKIMYQNHGALPISPHLYDFQIEIIDTCLDQAGLTPQIQVDPDIYYYTGSIPQAQFSMTPFTIDPVNFCTPVHTCTNTGQRTDLCTISDTGSVGLFDSISGDYQFESNDMSVALPGDYVFEITATVGSTVSSIQFTLTLVDPCLDQVALTIPSTHFLDKSYDLGSIESNQTWLMLTDLVNTDEWVDCGAVSIDFYLDDGSKTALNPLIFDDNRLPTPPEFTYLQTIDYAHIGTYIIKYNAYNENYPLNSIESVAFTVVISDPCPTATITLKPTPILDYEYVLRNPAHPQTWLYSDVFTIDTPVDCGDISVEIFNENDSALDATLFEDTRDVTGSNIFTLLQTEDVTKDGSYPISYKAFHTNYPGNFVENRIAFTVVVIDPCDIPVSLTPSIMTDQEYTITQDLFAYQVPVYTADPDWCAITYTYTITDPAGDAAVSFDDSTQIFTFQQLDDLSLSGNTFTDYTITVSGTIGNDTPILNSADFILKLKNPCIDSAYVTIQTQPLAAKGYALFQSSFTWTHAAFDIITVPITHTLCGEFTYEATFMDNPIDPLTTPVSYDSASKTYTIYTEDEALKGSQSFTIEAHLTNFPTVATAVKAVTAYIEIGSSCNAPSFVTAPTQMTVSPYSYTGATDKVLFTLAPFAVEPPNCVFTFSCILSSGPIDICNLTDGSTSGIFNGVTGNYEFQSIDMATYPAGTYELLITGTVGIKSDSFTLTVVLVDPCSTATITLKPTPILDYEYVLRNPAHPQTWLYSDVFTIDTLVDCGDISVEIFNENDSALDATLFEDIRDIAGSNTFTVLQTQDVSKDGTYPISYRAFHTAYPDNFEENRIAFTVVVIDPCDIPVSLTPSTLTDQEYTITQDQFTYQVPVYTVDPAWCAITYTYTITDPAGDAAVSFDDSTQIFTFQQLDDLSLSGNASTDYIIKVTGTAGNDTPVTGEETFNLQLKNPCINSDYVMIQSMPLPTGLSYILHDTEQVFTHSAFQMVIQPFVHSLCGDLSYTTQFNDVIIDNLSDPMSYIMSANEFTIYSVDYNLLGQNIIKVQGYLAQYTTITSGAPLETQIEIIDPCLDPFSLTMPVQVSPAEYLYTADDPLLSFTTDLFTVEPTVCTVTYSCEILTGSRTDICQILDGQTESTFDPATGSYTLKSIDTVNFLPGTYEMQITGTSGLKTKQFTINLVLVDPCFTVDLGILDNPFTSDVYVLRDLQIDKPWQSSDLILPKTNVDCGPVTVEFFNSDAGLTALDTDILDSQTTPNIFSVLYSEEVAKKGSYPIRYRVYHANYPLNIAVQPFPFTITIINSCEDPVSLISPVLSDQEYTITDNLVTYTVPIFTIDPQWCDVIYSFTVTDPSGQLAISFDANMDQRIFTFFNDGTDFTLAGVEFTDYTVQVTVDAGIVTFLQAQADFNFKILNPCVDLSFVEINKQALPVGLTYALWDFSPSPDGFKFTHDEFTVTTLPFDHTLCGDVHYKVFLDGTELSTSSEPMTYDTISRQFEIYGEDFDLIGMHQIVVQAFFVDYPLIVSQLPNLETEIEIENPCLRPASISTSASQINPPEYYYTPQVTIFNVNYLLVDPHVCPVTFECLSVIGEDPDVQCEDKDTVTFSTLTGQLTFKTNDMIKYTPGSYIFTMRGTVGETVPISTQFTFTLTLSNPCPIATLINLQTFPFVDMRYTLGRDSMKQPFDVNQLIGIDTQIDCGPIKIEFIDENENFLPTDIFSVEDDLASQVFENFIILQQRVSKTAGEYLIRYRASLEDYPSADPVLLSSPFKVTIVEVKQSDYIFNVEPIWLVEIKDQQVEMGDHLLYQLGEKTNQFGGEVNVKLDLRRIQDFTRYDSQTNSFIVQGDYTTQNDVGLHKIFIEVTYDDPRGRSQYFQSHFYLNITARPEDLIAFQSINPQAPIIEDKNITSTEFPGIVIMKVQEPRQDRPKPYIASVTPTGVMTIAWDRRMTPYPKPKEIPQTKVAIDVDIVEGGRSRRLEERQVSSEEQLVASGQETWYQDMERDRMIRVMLLDSLEVKMNRDTDSDDLTKVEKFEWDVIDYQENYIWLQFSFKNPDNVGSFYSQDYLSVTFWGIEFFKSFNGIEVEFGTELVWQIQRQVDVTIAGQLDTINDFVDGCIVFSSLAAVVFLGMGGRLLPTWMFLNSMQLIVHTPMLNTFMPSNLHYFLISFLNLVRINPKALDKYMLAWQQETIDGYEMAQSQDSLFSSLFIDCGYRYSFNANLIMVIILGLVFLVVLGILYVFDFIRARTNRPQNKKHGRSYNRSACMSNFTLRFIYEFFFEICLCIMIHMTTAGTGSTYLYILSVLLSIFIFVFVASLFGLFFRCGPYIPMSYERNSLRKSWWGARHLRKDAELDDAESCAIQDIEKQSSQPKLAGEEKGATERALLSQDDVSPVDFKAADIIGDPRGIILRQQTASPACQGLINSLLLNIDQSNNEVGSDQNEGGQTENASHLNLIQKSHLKHAQQAKELQSNQVARKAEAVRRVRLQEKVESSLKPGYRTLFYGLKLNHPHNVAIVHPMAFILRRVLYSIIIVSMANEKLSILFGVYLLILTCLFMTTMILLEGQWEDNLINSQHLANEVGFYLLCCCLVCFCGLIHDVQQNITIGYLTITMILTLIFYNIFVIMYELVTFIKLLILRYRVPIKNLIKLIQRKKLKESAKKSEEKEDFQPDDIIDYPFSDNEEKIRINQIAPVLQVGQAEDRKQPIKQDLSIGHLYDKNINSHSDKIEIKRQEGEPDSNLCSDKQSERDIRVDPSILLIPSFREHLQHTKTMKTVPDESITCPDSISGNGSKGLVDQQLDNYFEPQKRYDKSYNVFEPESSLEQSHQGSRNNISDPPSEKTPNSRTQEAKDIKSLTNSRNYIVPQNVLCAQVEALTNLNSAEVEAITNQNNIMQLPNVPVARKRQAIKTNSYYPKSMKISPCHRIEDPVMKVPQYIYRNQSIETPVQFRDINLNNLRTACGDSTINAKKVKQKLFQVEPRQSINTPVPIRVKLHDHLYKRSISDTSQMQVFNKLITQNMEEKSPMALKALNKNRMRQMRNQQDKSQHTSSMNNESYAHVENDLDTHLRRLAEEAKDGKKSAGMILRNRKSIKNLFEHSNDTMSNLSGNAWIGHKSAKWINSRRSQHNSQESSRGSLQLAGQRISINDDSNTIQ